VFSITMSTSTECQWRRGEMRSEGAYRTFICSSCMQGLVRMLLQGSTAHGRVAPPSRKHFRVTSSFLPYSFQTFLLLRSCGCATDSIRFQFILLLCLIGCVSLNKSESALSSPPASGLNKAKIKQECPLVRCPCSVRTWQGLSPVDRVLQHGGSEHPSGATSKLCHSENGSI
jgi:hypothetical protein